MVISVRKRYLSSGYYFSLVFIGHQGTGVKRALRSKVTGMIKRSKNQTKNIPRASNETPKIPWTENYLFTIPSEFTFFSPGSLELRGWHTRKVHQSSNCFWIPPKNPYLNKAPKKRPHFLFYKKTLNGISNPQKILSERFLIPPKTLLKSRHKKEPNFLLRKILKGKLQTQRKSFDHHRH